VQGEVVEYLKTASGAGGTKVRDISYERSPDFAGKRFIPKNGANENDAFMFPNKTKAAELAEPWRR